jgi:hypothetical protein
VLTIDQLAAMQPAEVAVLCAARSLREWMALVHRLAWAVVVAVVPVVVAGPAVVVYRCSCVTSVVGDFRAASILRLSLLTNRRLTCLGPDRFLVRDVD